ncbi:MAG TPA: RNA polymerase sigma factor [Bacteroidales bacterium]|nr:RNA polymerase sigma factor [Bacteroidales bacterium]
MEETSLINSIITGDEGAFRTFVDKYSVLVFRVIVSFGIRREDAEDLSQEVFIDVYHNIKKFRKESEISTWLYRIAINKTINHIKKNKQPAWTGKSADDIADMDNYVQVESSETKFVSEEQRVILYNSINRLSKNQKIAFTLNKLDELSYKEIAVIMNISVSSVESLLHRAKKNLQKSLLNFFK